MLERQMNQQDHLEKNHDPNAQNVNDEDFEPENEMDLENSDISQLGVYFRKIVDRITNRWYFRCEICLEEFQNIQCQSYTHCQHNRHFCTSCLTKYVKFKLIFFEQIRCPKDNCNAIMDIESNFFKNLPSTVQRRYRKIRASYQKLHDANFRTCPQQSCQGNIVYNGINFGCVLCKKTFCMNCLAKAHQGQCYYQQLNFFQNILQFRRCPKCKFVIEKFSGCDHMTCICKYQFCYKCNDTYTFTHRCQVDANNNIVMKNPMVKSNKKVEKEEKVQKPQETTIKSTISETIFLAFSVIVVLIPLFIIFIIVFLLWIGVLGLWEIIKNIFIILAITILGGGPYVCQYSNKWSNYKMVLLTIFYPFLIILGIHQAFKQLYLYLTSPCFKRYKKSVKKCWKKIFVDSMSD